MAGPGHDGTELTAGQLGLWYAQQLDILQSGRPPGSRWVPHVSGDITEVPLPCRHTEMTSPAVLGRAWDAIADWLGTTPARTA